MAARAYMLGKRLAIGPDCAIFEIFLLPDWNGALQRVNQPAARLECGGAMGGKDRDQNATFADLDPPQAMHHGQVANGKTLARSTGKFPQFLERHRLVSFVIEIQRAAAAAVIADHAVED